MSYSEGILDMQERLTFLAYYDQQLRIPNRTMLIQHIAKHHYTKEASYLISFDVASMRQLNSVYGRETGDALLRTIVEWVKGQAPENSTLYRIEGDMFGLLLYDSHLDQAKTTANRIYARFNDAWRLDINGRTSPYYCTVSVSIIPFANLLDRNVDNLLERTLDLSRNNAGVTLYDEKMDEESKHRIQLAWTLKNCVWQDMKGFDVHFQPIVDLNTGAWKGLEALCRWTTPDNGAISPAIFIPEAEKQGLIGILGFWVLERSIEVCKRYGLDSVDGFYLSVNISPIQIMDESFADRLVRLLHNNAYPGHKLNLEVTESVEFTFNRFSLNVVDKLRSYGVRFALDDFGTGYSSFNNLKNLPVSYVKTEKEFLDGIDDDKYVQYFYFIMAELAHANGMKLIAEGVETQEQLYMIRKNGADFVQGFFFSRPLAQKDLAAQLDHFKTPNAYLKSLNPKLIDLQQWVNGNTVYSVAPSLFKLLHECMQILVGETSIETAFANVLGVVGKHFLVNRAYAYIAEDKQGFVYSGDHSRPFHMQSIADTLLKELQTRDMLVLEDADTLAPILGENIFTMGIKAMLTLPIKREERLIGFVCFDSAIARSWHPDEIIMLWNLGIMMSNFISMNKLAIEVHRANSVLAEILNSTELSVYVADLDTNEILWANKSMKTRYQDNALIGKKCYEVLHGRSQRCELCRPHDLLRNPTLSRIAFEHYSERLERHFMVYDSLISWKNGKQVLIEYSLDITELRQAQKRIEQLMKEDLLTKTVNRVTLMECLRESLRQVGQEGAQIAITLVNIDGMADINAMHGEAFGDTLIALAAEKIRGFIRSNDVLGRIGGNEFVVVMPGCPLELARMHMAKARAEFIEASSGYTFRYGTVKSSELPYSPDDIYIGRLLKIARKRMQRKK